MAKTGQRELEAKFSVANSSVAQGLADAVDLVPGFALSEAHLTCQDDTYYDTASLGLLRHGYVLRIRESGGRVLVGIKGLASEHNEDWLDRYEDEHAVLPVGESPFVSAWPTSMRDFVFEKIGEQASLKLLVALHQKRVKRLLTPLVAADSGHTPGDPVVELSIDAVSVQPMAPTIEADRDLPIDFQTVEAELLPSGTPNQLRQVMRALESNPGLVAAASSKLESALLHLASSPRDMQPGTSGIQPHMHITEACRLIWRSQLAHMVFAEHGVRMDSNPEHVHEMRVAIRRARAAQKLLGAFFRPKALRAYAKAMRRLGRLAGAVRDLDVALESLKEYRKRTEKAHRAGLSQVQKELLRRRHTAFAALIEYLDSDKHEAFVAGFSHFSRTPSEGIRQSYAHPAPPDPVEVCHAFPTLLQERFARVRAFAPLLEGNALATTEQLHALRIECKYLRYAIEFGRQLLGPEGEELIEQLKRLQDLLGGINDAAVESHRLKEWQDAGLDSPAMQGRLADLEQKSQSLRAEAPAAFAYFISYENRLRLELAIARI